MRRERPVRLAPVFPALIAALSFLLGGCVYFNTFYNAQKAYDQALRMKEKRLEKDPEDSVLATSEEKLKLERSIAKSSKVLELYPDKAKYQPKALFLIGEAYMEMGEYSKAILKYEELQRFYPKAEEIRVAEFHRAKCLFLNGQYPFARTALEKVIASGDGEFREEALGYLARLAVADNSPAAALDIYEKLLKESAKTPEARANVHYEAAKLAFQLKQWERARGHARARDIQRLPSKQRYRADMLAAECLFRLGKPSEGIAELEAMRKARLYAPFVPEIDLKLAEGRFLLGQADLAMALLLGVPPQAPKTAFAAEAWYRLGEHHWHARKDEKKARECYDSAAAAGTQFEHGALAAERSQALGRLAELRKPADTAAAEVHYRDFMIAELFLFRLDNVDSALGRLDRIVADPRVDSGHTMRAAYARAFIQDEFKKSKPASDSLYRYVLEKYPNTDYAKQAERNLGLKPSVQTEEDAAHRLFLEAEAVRFGGGDVSGAVIPAYAKVVAAHPGTREAARAQFAIALLYEDLANGEEKAPGALDSAKRAYAVVRERYPKSPYFPIADAKLTAAGIKPGDFTAKSPAPASPAGSTPVSTPGAAAPAAAAPDQTAPATAPAVPPTTDTSTPATTTPAKVDEDRPKEELETDYENVDQY